MFLLFLYMFMSVFSEDKMLISLSHTVSVLLGNFFTKVLMFVLLSLNFQYFVYFVYLGFYVAFNTVQVISRRVVGRAEETST